MDSISFSIKESWSDCLIFFTLCTLIISACETTKSRGHKFTKSRIYLRINFTAHSNLWLSFFFCGCADGTQASAGCYLDSTNLQYAPKALACVEPKWLREIQRFAESKKTSCSTQVSHVPRKCYLSRCHSWWIPLIRQAQSAIILHFSSHSVGLVFVVFPEPHTCFCFFSAFFFQPVKDGGVIKAREHAKRYNFFLYDTIITKVFVKKIIKFLIPIPQPNPNTCCVILWLL